MLLQLNYFPITKSTTNSEYETKRSFSSPCCRLFNEKDRLFARANLDNNEFKLYQQVYSQLTINSPKPDLVIYLQSPVDVLMDRIYKRGRKVEQNIDRDYLELLNEAYSEFFYIMTMLHYLLSTVPKLILLIIKMTI